MLKASAVEYKSARCKKIWSANPPCPSPSPYEYFAATEEKFAQTKNKFMSAVLNKRTKALNVVVALFPRKIIKTVFSK